MVHVSDGALTTKEVSGIRHARPDILLLVGGTDGGNADVLLHNAARLAKGAIGGHGHYAVPVVLAGNVDARSEATALLEASRAAGDPRRQRAAPDRRHRAESARAAIREAFLRHVIGGKGLSRDAAFGQMVEAATPDVVLRGVEVVARHTGDGDVMVVDIGGATTDVYSVITPEGRTPACARTWWRRSGTRARSRATSGCAGTPSTSSRRPSPRACSGPS